MKSINYQSLANQIRWLMFFRVVTTTFLLVTTIVVEFRHAGAAADTALTALYGLIFSIYVLTVIYALILPRLAGEKVQAYIQIVGDLLATTAIIYLTGGLESIFSFMYILYIINAGILLKIRGAVMAASISAILYGALLDLHYYRYVSPYMTKFSYLDHYRATDILNMILVNMGAFYLVAFLAGYLSKQAEESRQKLAQRQLDLERLKKLNESIIQSIDSGLMTLGPGGEVLSFNPAAEIITGIQSSDIVNRPYREVFPEIELPLPVQGDPDQKPTWSWVYSRADGQEFFLDLALLSLRDLSGVDWGRLLVFQDRTHVRKMEEQVKKNERLAVVGELAAGIAHEIRNPLAAISGSFQMLESDLNLEGDQGRLSTIIRREMAHLEHIVNEFLLFARPQKGKPVPFNLSRSMADYLRMFKNQQGLSDSIIVRIEIDQEVWVLFDEHQLEQIMWNLLRNATEAMADGGELTVGLRTSGDDYPMAILTVSDTGHGISPEDIDRIFDPFFTSKEGGNGLGLSIVFRILENGGGFIDVDSTPNAGTTFTVHLPLYQGPN